MKEMDRMMGAEEWSMAEEAQAKDGRATGSESTTVGSVSNTHIAPHHRHIQYFSLYLDLAKCILHATNTAAMVHGYNGWVALTVYPVPLFDVSTPDAGLDHTQRAITSVVAILKPRNKRLILKVNQNAREGLLTSERV